MSRPTIVAPASSARRRCSPPSSRRPRGRSPERSSRPRKCSRTRRDSSPPWFGGGSRSASCPCASGSRAAAGAGHRPSRCFRCCARGMRSFFRIGSGRRRSSGPAVSGQGTREPGGSSVRRLTLRNTCTRHRGDQGGTACRDGNDGRCGVDGRRAVGRRRREAVRYEHDERHVREPQPGLQEVGASRVAAVRLHAIPALETSTKGSMYRRCAPPPLLTYFAPSPRRPRRGRQATQRPQRPAPTYGDVPGDAR